MLSGVRDVTVSDAFNWSVLGPRRNVSALPEEPDSGEHEGAYARLRRRHNLFFEVGFKGFARLIGVGGKPSVVE